MNSVFQATIVGACKALFSAGYSTAPAIVRLLTNPSELETQARKDLKALLTIDSNSSNASVDSVEAKLRSFVGLAGGGESIKVTAPGLNGGGHNVYSVS
jgi:hypothetical protein